MKKIKWLVPTVYIIFLMLPIYWLLNMSFKTTTEIINVYSLWPKDFTLENYVTILQIALGIWDISILLHIQFLIL